MEANGCYTTMRDDGPICYNADGTYNLTLTLDTYAAWLLHFWPPLEHWQGYTE